MCVDSFKFLISTYWFNSMKVVLSPSTSMHDFKAFWCSDINCLNSIFCNLYPIFVSIGKELANHFSDVPEIKCHWIWTAIVSPEVITSLIVSFFTSHFLMAYITMFFSGNFNHLLKLPILQSISKSVYYFKLGPIKHINNIAHF